MNRQPWLAVELRHLAALSAIAREGSFRAAADSLGYVQSAVSEQIAALESSLGVSVLERRRGTAPAALTEAGELLLCHFDEVLSIFTAAEADLEALRSGRRGRLRVGVYESVAVRVMPALLTELGRELPDVKVELVTSSTGDELPELVESGQLDVAFGSRPVSSQRFASRELFEDPYVLMTPASWPLALAGAPPTVAQLCDLPLIGPAAGKRAALAEAELRTHGLEPRYELRAEGNSALQALVGAGMGAAIVPRLSVDETDVRVALLELDGLVSPRTVTLFWQESRSNPLLERFAQLAARCTWSESRRGTVAPALAA